jgi:hypothetical protein
MILIRKSHMIDRKSLIFQLIKLKIAKNKKYPININIIVKKREKGKMIRTRILLIRIFIVIFKHRDQDYMLILFKNKVR